MNDTCPVCGKWRSAVNSVAAGFNPATSFQFVQDEGGISSVTFNANTPGYSGVVSSSMEFCPGTGECASKQCPTCGWYIPRGDEHDCAKLAGITGKAGTISRNALTVKFHAVLDQAKREVALIESDYKHSIDENGQPNAPWLAETIEAFDKALDDAARIAWAGVGNR